MGFQVESSWTVFVLARRWPPMDGITSPIGPQAAVEST